MMDEADEFVTLGTAFAGQGHWDRAEECFGHALSIDPGRLAAHYGLGHVLDRTGRTDAAAARYRLVACAHPEAAEVLHNLGVTEQAQGRFDHARALFRRGVVLDPGFAPARYAIALLDLMAGRFAEGWAGYEWRRKVMRRQPPLAPIPLWDGTAPEGRRLLVFADQGFGDTIQFIRFARVLKDRGASVTVGCPAPLARLLATADGVDRVVTTAEDAAGHDAQAALGSLPYLLGLGGDTRASVPYLHARTGIAGRGERLRVGFVWRGTRGHADARNRNLDLSWLAPLLDTPGVDFVSLQKDVTDAERTVLTARANVTVLSDELRDFADTASVIAGLDQVIAVDTAVAHLAGALGRPVWVLLPAVPDWRWQLGRDDSPWYPSARLFRQGNDRVWGPVLARVSEALVEVAQAEHAAGNLTPPPAV